MLRYLSRADVHSDRRIQWGILTNGRLWRLYWQGARSRSEQFLELDLPAILGLQGFADDLFAPTSAERSHWLKVFMLMFRRSEEHTSELQSLMRSSYAVFCLKKNK